MVIGVKSYMNLLDSHVQTRKLKTCIDKKTKDLTA